MHEIECFILHATPTWDLYLITYCLASPTQIPIEATKMKITI